MLNSREKTILRYVIHQFILTANPVGSRNITKKYEIGLSPATVRNIMADLEEFGYLNHPHTSAGRVPTDKGYRFYVDSLMEISGLTEDEKLFIETGLNSELVNEQDELLKTSSMLLSKITNQLVCVTYPSIEKAVLHRMQLVQLSSTRLLVVLTVKSGMVKTITLEFEHAVKQNQLKGLETILNERLSGLNFSEIRTSFKERLKDRIDESLRPIVRLFLDSSDKIFENIKEDDKTIITGAKNILKQPEFEDLEHYQGIIELIEDKDIIIHLMDKGNIDTTDISILIGSEHQEKRLEDYSMISKNYKVGDSDGVLGIVGPKRMDYSGISAALIYVAEKISRHY